jgi:hypothetical protein
MLLLLLASNSWHAWFQGIISQLNHSQRPCRLSTIIPENKFHMWLGLLTKNLYPCFPPPNFDRLSCQGMKAHHPHPPPVLYIFSPAGTLNIVFHKSMLAGLCSWMSSVSSKHSKSDECFTFLFRCSAWSYPASHGISQEVQYHSY